MPNRLKVIRTRKGISQVELAKRIGVSRQALNAVEANRQDPSLTGALRIARVLNVPVQQIFYIEDELMEDVKIATLTKVERLVLINQYKILSALSSDDEHMSTHYQRLEDIFERGFVTLYREALGQISDEFPAQLSTEVFDILNLHRAMFDSVGQSPSPEALERVKFRGFDANTESEHLSFARFITKDGDRYKESPVHNSHMPTLARYRKMLAEWRRLGESYHLTKPQIESILEAGTFYH